MKPLVRAILIFAVCAIIGHFAYVVSYPRLIMRGTMAAIETRAGGANKTLRPPLPDETARGIVKPSSDLLYALCVFDVGAGPVVITSAPSVDYWSAAIYGANTDNVFVLNDRQAGGKPVALVIATAEQRAKFPAAPGNARIIEAPSQRGIVLFRNLVADPADPASAKASVAATECNGG